MIQNLSAIRNAQSSVMDDLCNIYHVGTSSGTYGNNTETSTIFASGVHCGIHLTNGQIIQRGQVMFVDYDCILRLPDTVQVGMTDEIELVQKGNFQISGTFKPFSEPTVNSSVQHVLLKRQVP